MIRRIGLAQCGEFVCIGFPVEITTIYDDAAQTGTMTADELCGRVYYDVGTVLNGTDEVGRAKGIVNNEGQVVTVCHFGQCIDVGNVAIGIAESLCIDGAGVGPDGCLYSLKVVDIDYGVLNTLIGQRVGYQIVGAAIKVVGSYDVLT